MSNLELVKTKLPPEVVASLKATAKVSNTTVSAMLRDIVQHHLANGLRALPSAKAAEVPATAQPDAADEFTDAFKKQFSKVTATNSSSEKPAPKFDKSYARKKHFPQPYVVHGKYLFPFVLWKDPDTDEKYMLASETAERELLCCDADSDEGRELVEEGNDVTNKLTGRDLENFELSLSRRKKRNWTHSLVI